MLDRIVEFFMILFLGMMVGTGIGIFLEQHTDRSEQSQFARHVPADCSWKEIERDGDWQQTCDDNQKRTQR